MRIQNNITAMNTHRMYTINNDNVAKSAEKLSSGYRINRAADDAAGLAISEKMRAQIRGLNMATKNSQDAISLVQTAEGALQETQNMLQRMNELAVQAATGTNESFDRTQAAKEFEQLKREINDVAEQTNFNNMKILDGSLSYEGYQRSAATAGVTNTIATSDVNALDSAVSTVYSINADEGVASGDAKDVTVTSAIESSISGLKNGENFSVKIELADGRTLVSSVFKAGGNSQAVTTTDATDANIVSGLGNSHTAAGNKLTFTNGDDSTHITIAGNGTNIELKAGKAVGDAEVDFTGAKVTIIKHDGDAKKDTVEVSKGGAITTANAGDPMANIPEKAAVDAKAEYKFDLKKISYGDTFQLNGTTYEVVRKGETPSDASNTAVEWNGKTDDTSDLIDNLKTAIGTTATATSKTTLQIAGSAVTQGDRGTADASDKSVQLTTGSSNSYAGRTNTIEFDVAKMKDGDTFTVKSGSKEVKVTYNEGDTRDSFMKKVAAKAAGTNGIGEVKGNALIIKDAKVDSIDLQSGQLPETNAIRIQVGAQENEQLSISIDSMNTKGLGLDDATLVIPGASTTESQDKAGEAITATREAINKVSDQRATLGAMQNRLDHKIANLKVSSENLSAAESRIRDVDMASEMTNFTKNNILSQAATAMLAQANALPQNVLSLLG